MIFFPPPDVSPPTITCPGTQLGTTEPGDVSTRVDYTPLATAHDDSSDDVTLRYSIPSGAVFHLSQTPVKVTGVDSSLNRVSCVFIVEVSQPGSNTKSARW